jgi:thiopeptide-type bacteriocin biosynthesis protein
VLSRAAWTVQAAEFKAILDSRSTERFRRMQEWRVARALPRFCQLIDGDNEFLVDLDNILSIDTFCDLVKRRASFRLSECLPAANELAVHGPEGGFAHEIIVPLLRRRGSHEAVRPPIRPPVALGSLDPASTTQELAPGSEWLFLKLYGGESTADSVLTEAVHPAIDALRRSGAIDRWFFVRYGDPESHLRIRLHGDPARLCGEALPLLHSRLKPMLGGRLWRIELGTYQRETDRYGGPASIVHAERLFDLDSEAVTRILRACAGDEGIPYRWQLALSGADRWLRDFGLDLPQRRRFAREARDGYMREMRAEGKSMQGWLAERFRKERATIEPLVQPDHRASNPALTAGLEALELRSRASFPILEEMRRLQARGELTRHLESIAHSLIHMYCNRLLRSAQRTQEFVIYEFLARLYDSELARQRRPTTPASQSMT